MSAPDAAAPAIGGRPPASGVTATARGGRWGLVGSAVNAVFGYLLVTLVTRALGAHGAGAVFTGVAVFTVLGNTCKLGADTGLVRFIARDVAVGGGRQVGALLRTAVIPGAVVSTAAAAVLFLWSPAAVALLPDVAPDDAVTLVRIFAVFLPPATVTLIWLGATQGHGTVIPFVAVEQIGKPVLRVLLAVPVALVAPGVLSLAVAWLLPTLTGALAAWLALRRCRAGRPAPPGPGTAAVRRGFWAFSAPRAVSSVFDITAVWIGVVLLSGLSTSEEAGIYTAVGRVVAAATLLQLAVRLAFAPEISRLLALDLVDEACHLHRVSTRWIVLFSWPLLVLLAHFPGTVLALFGPEFTRGSAALIVLCAASAINVGVGNAQTVLLMAGRSSWHLALTGAAFAVQLTVGVLTVQHLGALGAALAWGAAIVVENLVAAVLVRRHPGFTTVDGGYLAATGAGLGLTVAVVLPVRLLAGDTGAGLALGITLAACVFAAVLRPFRTTLGVSDLVEVLRARIG
ncbi:oligosaccharide flippase family protein [Streptomyces actinomycinicus]|uniref:Oligosaccharide flippase family protein n=1 Tax=Streptomyces actinomycinicus TaxID=1695166 RepID=A0A937EJ84_9ACTN|nr:oligosaccharide flippase family protein [Streptomyces actinomycinicus]MBL1083024.1 oligosaccharide flippase family protein [Streptomyces actinomycinicus]